MGWKQTCVFANTVGITLLP